MTEYGYDGWITVLMGFNASTMTEYSSDGFLCFHDVSPMVHWCILEANSLLFFLAISFAGRPIARSAVDSSAQQNQLYFNVHECRLKTVI